MKLEYIALDKIKPDKANARKDFGDLRELEDSIIAHGVRTPLQLNEDQVKAGSRRLQALLNIQKRADVPAARKKELSEVPVFHLGDSEDAAAIALMDNLQRKNLTYLEEAAGFSDYLTAKDKKFNPGSAEGARAMGELAASMGKKPEYVQRRVALLALGPDARKALDKGVILIGHAVVLASVPLGEQKAFLNEIISDEVGPKQFAKMLVAGNEYRAGKFRKMLKGAVFDTSPCARCPNNGACQAILSETGMKLEGTCFSPKCFQKKEEEWVAAESKRLTEKGVKVLSDKEVEAHRREAQKYEGYGHDTPPASFKHWERIYPPYPSDKMMVERSDVFAVYFQRDSEWEPPKKRVYCIDKAKLQAEKRADEAKRAAALKKKAKATGQAVEVCASAKEKLERKLEEFMHGFVEQSAVEHAMQLSQQEGPATIVKALVAFELHEHRDDYGSGREAMHRAEARYEAALKQVFPKIKWKEGCSYNSSEVFAGFLKAKEEALDRFLTEVAPAWLAHRHGAELGKAAEGLGFNLEKDFKLSEELLALYTTDQAVELAKELGVDLGKAKKKSEIVYVLMAAKKLKCVPKSVKDAYEEITRDRYKDELEEEEPEEDDGDEPEEEEE